VTNRKRFDRLLTRLGCLGVLAVAVVIVMGAFALTFVQSVGVVVAGTLLVVALALLAAWVERLCGMWKAP
jgi:hypothetical protein